MEAEQGEVDVGGDDQLDPAEPLACRDQPLQPVVGEVGQPGASPGERLRGADPQRGQHPGAPVVDTAAADAHDETARRLGQRRLEQLPHAVRAGPGGVALRLGQQVQPAGLGRLDVDGAVTCVLDHEQGGGHRAPERVADGDGDALAAEGAGEDVEEAGAAVGQRQQGQPVVRRRATPALGDRVGGLAGRERAGEAVGGDEDAHRVIVSARTAPVAAGTTRRQAPASSSSSRTSSSGPPA